MTIQKADVSTARLVVAFQMACLIVHLILTIDTTLNLAEITPILSVALRHAHNRINTQLSQCWILLLGCL